VHRLLADLAGEPVGSLESVGDLIALHDALETILVTSAIDTMTVLGLIFDLI